MRALLSPLLLLAGPALAQQATPALAPPVALMADPLPAPDLPPLDLLAFTDPDTRMTVPVQIADNGP